jgi:hypothetical protein
MDVAREKGGFFDVGESTSLEDDTVDAETAATVGREAELEGVEVVLETRVGDVEADRFHLFEHLVVVVLTEGAGGDFDAAIEEVGPIDHAAFDVDSVVELSGFDWELASKDKVGAEFFASVVTNPALFVWDEVFFGGSVGLSGLGVHLVDFGDSEDWDLIGKLELWSVEGFEVVSAGLISLLEDVLDGGANHVEDVLEAIDEAHLDIEHGELGEVASGGARLGAVGVVDFEDALKGPDHDLFVELWALGESSLAVEIIDLEDLGAAFGGFSEELRGVDFDEFVVDEELAEILGDGGADAENALLIEVADVEDAVLKESIEVFVVNWFVDFDWRLGRDRHLDGHDDLVELGAAWGAFVGDDLALDSENGADLETAKLLHLVFVFNQHLDEAGAVTQSDEVEATEEAFLVEPTASGDGFACVLG